MENCEYCDLDEKDDFFLFETKFWKIVLSDEQAYLGRMMVISKRHCGDLAELSKEEILDFFEVLKKIEKVMRKVFGAVYFNWTCLVNSFYKLKNPDPHLHWHCRPRYDKKINFEGTIFKDPNFAHHYNRKPGIEHSKELKKKIAEFLKKKF